MNMRKIIFAGCAAVSLLPLVGCNSSDDPELLATHLCDTYNLFTPILGSKASFATQSKYRFDLNATAMTATAECQNLTFDGAVHTLSIPMVKMKLLRFPGNMDYAEFSSATGILDGTDGAVGGFQCVFSGLFYPIPEPVRIPTVNGQTAYRPFVIAQYRVGSMYDVATFPTDATYRGITSTSFEYKGQQQTYKTKAGSYRVVMNPGTLKADVVLYKVKFAEQSPALVLVLKDLDVKFERNAYSISGMNVNPRQVEGNNLTENDSFPFESFKLSTTTADLATISIEYTVRNKAMEEGIGNGVKVYYKGSFAGSYVNNPDDPFNPDTPVE